MSEKSRLLAIAYLAGIIDGEGSFLIERHRMGRFRPLIKIKMNDQRVMKWIHSTFGGTLIRFKEDPNINREAGFVWKMRDKIELLKIVPELLEFLITKKFQAQVVLAYAQAFNRGRSKARYTEDDLVQMTDLADLLKALNSRGIGSNDRKAALYAIADSKPAPVEKQA